jgi:hypothetical protein
VNDWQGLGCVFGFDCSSIVRRTFYSRGFKVRRTAPDSFFAEFFNVFHFCHTGASHWMPH